MTIPLNPERQCKGKTRFETKAAAKRWSRRDATNHGGRDRMQAYRCPHCKGFHLGHSNPALRDRQRNAS